MTGREEHHNEGTKRSLRLQRESAVGCATRTPPTRRAQGRVLESSVLNPLTAASAETECTARSAYRGGGFDSPQ